MFALGLNLVNRMPRIFTPGLQYFWTLVTVSLSWEIPAVAKIPAVVGIRISVAQVKAFTVSTPREGGVSITMKSYSPATGATASFSRCSFPV